MRNFRQHQCKIKQKEIEKFEEYNPNITLSTIEHLFDEYRQLSKDMKNFDIEEPWYNQQHWNSRCDRCGCIRKERGHYVAHKKVPLYSYGMWILSYIHRESKDTFKRMPADEIPDPGTL